LGSFLNLVSDRLIKGESIIIGRSHCDFCKKPLRIKNLIPVFSFLVQKARCSFCKKKLSWFYPFSEILTGLLLVAAVNYSGVFVSHNIRNIWDFAFLAVIFASFIIMFLTDAKYSLLCDSVSNLGIGAIIIFVLGGQAIYLLSLYQKLAIDSMGIYLLKVGYWNLQLSSTLQSLAYTIVSALVITLFFYLLVKLTKGKGMGEGDIKLGLIIGLFNGFPYNFIAIFLGFLYGSIYSLTAVALRKKTLKDHVPFGPFLLLGSVTALLWGGIILNWYVDLF